MTCKRGALISGLISGLASGVMIYRLHAAMMPDFQSYASGHSCWSSVVTCATGKIGGASGVRLLSLAGGISAGFLCSNPIGVSLVLATPIGAGITNAGADSIGATAFITCSASTKKVATFLLVSACHLVAGLCWLCVLAGKLIGLKPWVSATIGGTVAIVAQFVIARTTGIHFSGIQWRYLLPGILLGMSKSTPNVTG